MQYSPVKEITKIAKRYRMKGSDLHTALIYFFVDLCNNDLITIIDGKVSLKERNS